MNLALKLARILSSIVLLRAPGGTGVNLKDETGVLGVKNAADNAYAGIKALGAEFATLKVTTSAGANKLLVSDADGDLVYTDPSAIGIVTNQVMVDVTSFTQASSSPLALFTPPANAIIQRITVVLSVAAGTTAATISVGTSGTPARDLATTDIDMTSTDVQVVEPWTDPGAAVAMVLTIVHGSQTFTGKVYIHYFVPG